MVSAASNSIPTTLTWSSKSSASNMNTVLTTLNVARSMPRGPIKSTIKVHLPLDTVFDNLAPIIQQIVDPNFTLDKYHIDPNSRIALRVTTEASTYDPSCPGGLKINIEEPLAQYYKTYRRHHGLAPAAKSSSESSLTVNTEVDENDEKTFTVSTVTVGPAQFRFVRTLRVPDNGKKYALPPGMGTFPIAKAQDYATTLPDHIKKRGGYLMPLFQREALWIRIIAGDCAIKISVGGINAITGGKRNEKPPNGVQDYVVGGKQPWLDGIVTEPGVVRQFVAMKLGHGYTIEEQLSDTANGGIQIDVFPSLVGVVTFRLSQTPSNSDLALDKSPQQLNIMPDEIILMTSRKFPPIRTLRDMVKYATTQPVFDVVYDVPAQMQIFVKTVSGRTVAVRVETFETVHSLKAKIGDIENIAPDRQVLRFAGKLLDDGSRTLAHYGIKSHSTIFVTLRLRGGGGGTLKDLRMGIAAGGKISQKIYQNPSHVVYDDENPHRVFIHTVSSAGWEMITGVVCPMTPITPGLYKAYKYPWFNLYDERLPTIHHSGAFNAVRSIGELDNAPHSSSNLIDPESPPNCPRHEKREAVCVLRPCAHPACSQCFGESIIAGSQCALCSQSVEKYVGFDKPVPTVTRGGGSVGNWWEAEARIDGVLSESPEVITLMLDEDSVCGLHDASKRVLRGYYTNLG